MPPSHVLIRKILVDLYPTEREARRIAADALLDTSQIYFSSQAIINWSNILLEATKQNKLDFLLQIINSEYGGNKEFRAMYIEYQRNPTLFRPSVDYYQIHPILEGSKERGCFLRYGRFVLAISLSIILVLLAFPNAPLQLWLRSILRDYLQTPTPVVTPIIILLPSPVSTPILLPLTSTPTEVALTLTTTITSTISASVVTAFPQAPSGLTELVTPTPTEAAVLTVTLTFNSTPSRAIGKFNAVNVRAHPDRSAPPVGQIRIGEEYEIIARYSTAYWLYICCINGNPVWVEENLVTVIGNSNNVPTILPSSTVTPSHTFTPTPVVSIMEGTEQKIPTLVPTATSFALPVESTPTLTVSTMPQRSPAPTSTPTPWPAPTPTPWPAPTPTRRPAPTPTPWPAPTPTRRPVPTSTPWPTSTPRPTPMPTFTPLVLPTREDHIEGCNFNPEEMVLARLILNHTEQNRQLFRCNPILASVARSRAEDMGRRAYFNHVNPDGLGPNYLVRQAGYVLPSNYSQELNGNDIEAIGAGPNNADGMWEAWMLSTEHSTHILGKTDFFAEQVDFGIGFAQVPESPYQYYWVFISAKPGP